MSSRLWSCETLRTGVAASTLPLEGIPQACNMDMDALIRAS